MATSKTLVTSGVSVMAAGLVVNLLLDAVGSASVSQAGSALFILSIVVGLLLVAAGVLVALVGLLPRRRRRRRRR